MNVCKQTFYISYMRISQKEKGAIIQNLQHIISYEGKDISVPSILMVYEFFNKKRKRTGVKRLKLAAVI